MNENYLMIFEKNTDAVGTNRGFLYQYLLTLKQWLNNYLEKNDRIIYCETEDDLKEISETEDNISFKQMKCYGSPFSLKSDDMKKTLYNFFILGLKYSFTKIKAFEFVTNSRVSGTDLLLLEWSENNTLVNDTKEKLATEIQKLLEKIVIDETFKKINAIKVKIKNRKEKQLNNISGKEKLELQIIKFETDISEIKEEEGVLIGKINSHDNIISFMNKILWKFENIETEESIDLLKIECVSLIKSIEKAKLSPNIILCRLLTEVLCRSSEKDFENRILDINLMENIINESEEEMLSKGSVSLVNLLENRFDKIENILGDIKNDIKDIKCNDNQSSEGIKYYDMPYYDEREIEYFIEKEDEKIQSKLENKINMMELKEEDSEILKDIAREHRCSYLMYLGSLRVSNLEQELDTIKNLERAVRRVCFDAVQDIQSEEEFNSNTFWNKFKKELELKAKEYGIKRKCDIDESITHGQMYQMAAECPLRWHK
jgi:hypothetical protein